MSFSQIIDQDHNEILLLARKLLKQLQDSQTSKEVPPKASSDLQTITMTRDEFFYRLVRHDVSEEIVLRPAFKKHLGDEGLKYASNDAQDHADAKVEVLQLMDIDVTNPKFFAKVAGMLKALAEHMRNESGYWIPRLEKAMPDAESHRLGTEYKKTWILKPDLDLPPALCQPQGANTQASPSKAFSGIEQYLRTDTADFKRLLQAVSDRNISDESEPPSEHKSPGDHQFKL